MNEARSGGRPPRPLSPHLQIYRWPITMGTSILHRITGMGLIAASMGSDTYAVFEGVAFHWFGRLVLFGFTVALVFHALNGVRHLFWDAGAGFKMATANASGLVVYGLTAVLTLLIWVVAYRSMGGL
jgi:succinate dehydrogenase / fumarate reductase cytochrome b subunit